MIAVGTDGATRRRGGARRRRGARVPHGRPAGRRRALGADPARGRPFVRQELAETLYHVLWELVHVFFDHRGLLEGRQRGTAHDSGGSAFLYPFLAEEQHDLEAVVEDVRASVLMKADEVGRAPRADAAREPRRAGGGGGGLRASLRRRRRTARAGQRRVGDRRAGRGRRPARGPAGLARPPGPRPGRGPLDHHRDRQRRRRGGASSPAR